MLAESGDIMRWTLEERLEMANDPCIFCGQRHVGCKEHDDWIRENYQAEQRCRAAVIAHGVAVRKVKSRAKKVMAAALEPEQAGS